MINENRSTLEENIRKAMKDFAQSEGFVNPNLETGEGCTAFVDGINGIMEANNSSERWELVPITTYKIQRKESI